VERPHVAPVQRLFGVDVVEVVRYHTRVLQVAGNDVASEIVGRVGILRVLVERAQQHIGVEQIHTHRGADHGRVEDGWTGRAVPRLLFEAGDPVIGSDLEHAEAAGFGGGHTNGGDGDVGPVRAVPGDHFAVVHLIDVIAGENQRA